MNIQRYLILLTGMAVMSCAQTSTLIYQQYVPVSSWTLQVQVFDRGKRLSTRHAMITVKNMGKAPVTLGYLVAVQGKHRGAIQLQIQFKEGILAASEQLMRNHAIESGRTGSHKPIDFIVNLQLAAGKSHQFYLDTSYNTEQAIEVNTRTLSKQIIESERG